MRSGVGLISFLSECPSCGEVIQSEPPPYGVTMSVIGSPPAAFVVSVYFYHRECGASWLIERGVAVSPTWKIMKAGDLAREFVGDAEQDAIDRIADDIKREIDKEVMEETMGAPGRTRAQVKKHLDAVKIDVPPKPFAHMTLDELAAYIEHCKRLIESARNAANDAKAEFDRCCEQTTWVQNLYDKRVAALKMDPGDRLIALVEDLMKRGCNEMADHVAENWADDDGVVVVIGLEDFDEHARASLVTSAENCGFDWRGF